MDHLWQVGLAAEEQMLEGYATLGLWCAFENVTDDPAALETLKRLCSR